MSSVPVAAVGISLLLGTFVAQGFGYIWLALVLVFASVAVMVAALAIEMRR